MTHRPAGTYHPPNPVDHVAALGARTTALEQRPQPGPYVPRFCLTATNPEPIDEARSTQEWRPWMGAVRLEYVITTMRTLSTPVTVLIRRSGVAVVTVEMDDAGVSRLGADEVWTPGDWLDLTISGTVHSVDVQMWFRGEGGGGIQFIVPPGGDG